MSSYTDLLIYFRPSTFFLTLIYPMSAAIFFQCIFSQLAQWASGCWGRGRGTCRSRQLKFKSRRIAMTIMSRLKPRLSGGMVTIMLMTCVLYPTPLMGPIRLLSPINKKKKNKQTNNRVGLL